MKLIAGILLLGMTTGIVWGQNQNVITDTKSKLTAVQQKKTAESNAALAASETSAVQSPYATKPGSTRSAQAGVAAKGKVRTAGATVPSAAPTHQAHKADKPADVVAVEDTKAVPDSDKPAEPPTISLNGHRDPFVSPVVSRSMSGSGCSTGKRCLAIDQINLRGVVKSDGGMIAVVVNALDKAYFLHENDPVFNGYVVRITGDSVIFKETVPDKFGKPFSREVTKKIFTPAV